jgi:hypothetical protein
MRPPSSRFSIRAGVAGHDEPAAWCEQIEAGGAQRAADGIDDDVEGLAVERVG